MRVVRFRPSRSPEDELRGFEGLRDQVRLEALASRLVECSVAVAHCANGRVVDRAELHLDDGSVLRLRLFRPNDAQLAALTSITWDDDVGWIVGGRATDGRAVRLLAWRASLDPA